MQTVERINSEESFLLEGDLSFSSDFLDNLEYAIYYDLKCIGHIYPNGTVTLVNGSYSKKDLLDIINKIP